MGISPPIEVANLGMADSLILMVLALVVFGPRRLPQIGRQIGKLMYEFRKASNDFKFQMEEELRNAEEADRRKREEAERQRSVTLVPPPQPASQAVDQAAGSGIGEATEAPAATSSSETPSVEEDNFYETYADSAAAYERQNAEAAPETAGRLESMAAAETGAAQTALQVRPPSTGETVPAERPGSAIGSAPAAESETTPAAETGAAAETESGRGPEPGAAPPEVNHRETEAAAEEHDAAAEPTAHHG